jgi:hypothetical protein
MAYLPLGLLLMLPLFFTYFVGRQYADACVRWWFLAFPASGNCEHDNKHECNTHDFNPKKDVPAAQG